MPRQPSPDIQIRNLNDTMKRLPRHLQIAWIIDFCGRWDPESLVMGRALEFLTYLKEKAQPEPAPEPQPEPPPIPEVIPEITVAEAVPIPEAPPAEEWYEGPVSGLTGSPLTQEDLSGYLVNGCPMAQTHILDMASGYADAIDSMTQAVTVLRDQGFDVQEPD